MAIWDDNVLKAGELWQQKEFPCFTLMIQPAPGGQWMFMAPAVARESKHGWFGFTVMTNQEGKWLRSTDEAIEHLTKYKYTRMNTGVDSYFHSGLI